MAGAADRAGAGVPAGAAARHGSASAPTRWQLGRSQELARTRSVRTSRALPTGAHPGRRGHFRAIDGKTLPRGHRATKSALASNAGLLALESAFPVTQSLGCRTVPWLCVGWPVAVGCAAGSVTSGYAAPTLNDPAVGRAPRPEPAAGHCVKTAHFGHPEPRWCL